MSLGELIGFCEGMGGKLNIYQIGAGLNFECHVDPETLLKRWDELVKLLDKVKSEEVSSACFGKFDEQFCYYPLDAEGVFYLSEYLPPGEEESLADLFRDVEEEFYDFMEKHGIVPEFDFIPTIDVGSVNVEENGMALEREFMYVGASVPKSMMDEMKNIIANMLKFKEKLNRMVKSVSSQY